MQNKNAGKTVEQIAHDHAMKADAGQQETAKYSFIEGFNHAQQSQPMWRRINPSDNYYDKIVTDFVRTLSHPPMSGQALLSVGYTHYLSSEDLLKLPTEKK